MEAGAKPARILLVGADPRAAATLADMLREVWPHGLLIIQTHHIADAVHELNGHGATCVLLEPAPTSDRPLAGLEQLVAAESEVPVIVVSEHGDDGLGVQAIAAGAQDHLVRSELAPAMLGRAVSYAAQRKRAESELARQALHDPLTALPNRVLFGDRLKVALDRSRRTALPVAVMFLDVDSFKEINDTLGHAAGDALLTELAARFSALLRPMDTVARFGGDEFCFLFEGLADDEEAVLIAERIRSAAGRPIALGEPAVHTSVAVSVGIAMVDDPGASPEDLIGEADAAMYRAKDGGGSRCAVHLGTPAKRPAAARDALSGAVSSDQLRLHYQPRVSINGETGLVGFEALVRWEHPERGLVAPAEFVPLAEETGLIAGIDDWVLGEAARQIGRWRQSRPGMTIHVNLSGRALHDPGLARRLERIASNVGADPNVLWLDVPEAAVEADPVAARRALSELRTLGVRLALDDFGTGRMSLRDLRGMPVDMLKIHESFIAGLSGDGAPALVGAVVELGHALGMSVVAEGVETEDQLGLLRDLGCDGAQGFLFSKPVSADEVSDLLGG